MLLFVSLVANTPLALGEIPDEEDLIDAVVDAEDIKFDIVTPGALFCVCLLSLVITLT